MTTAKQVQFSEAVLTAGNECVGVLLASMEPCGQLMEAVLVYGLDQLDCCRACGSDYNLAVLSLVTLVHWPLITAAALCVILVKNIVFMFVWSSSSVTHTKPDGLSELEGSV